MTPALSNDTLVMPAQDLSRPYRDPAAPPSTLERKPLARIAVGLPALVTTGLLLAAVLDWFEAGGYAVAEIAMAGLMAFTFFWIALSVSTATLGILVRRTARASASAIEAPRLRIAILLPVYSEDPTRVFAGARAMLDGLARTERRHDYALHVLSDTRSPDAVAHERAVFAERLADSVSEIAATYRNREHNTCKKAGNIAEWVMRDGASSDAMLVLDADSLMTPETIAALADAMARDPSAGLVQSVPRIIGARTLFARAQQFACNVYGPVLAAGLARWTGDAGNYWGHNAIIRTRAFAASAGLPDLPGRGPLSGLILSHDFVEAALLRRAGWSVHILPEPRGSFEETPPTLIDHVLRDRRWCQGNLQHLRLLFASGLHPLSRFHLLQGAMAYLTSLAWFTLLLLWAAFSSREAPLVRYFSPENPLFPMWPEIDLVSRVLVLCFVYAMLVAPKMLGILGTLIDDPALRTVGGPVRFLGSALLELALSIALAPIMMVQQVRAVLRTFAGIDAGWAPQRRAGERDGWRTLLAFHWLETALGVLLVAGLLAGQISPWIAPIAASLALAVPISALMQTHAFAGWLGTPETYAPPGVYTELNRALDRPVDAPGPSRARPALRPRLWRPRRA